MEKSILCCCIGSADPHRAGSGSCVWEKISKSDAPEFVEAGLARENKMSMYRYRDLFYSISSLSGIGVVKKGRSWWRRKNF